MENVLRADNSKKFRYLYAFIAVLAILFHLITELVFQLWYRVAANYGLFLIIAFITLSFFLRFFNSRKEEKCIVAYAVWVLISRILNGDMFLDTEFYFLIRTVLFSGCFICVGFVLENEERKNFFNFICAVVCGYWFILAVIGLYATMNFTRIEIPPSDMTVGYAVIVNGQLTVDNIHRNVSGVWFALATVLMLCYFVTCKNKYWRVPIFVALIVFFFATAMSFSRSAQIGLCTSITMLVMLLILKRFSKRKTIVKMVAVVLAVSVCLPLSFASFSVATNICSAISSGSAEENTVELAEDLEENNIEAELVLEQEHSGETVEGNAFEESRKLDNVMMLGGRLYLWKAGMMILAEEPERLVKGEMIGTYMDAVSARCRELAAGQVNENNSQMHNFILDPLLLTGLPGMLAIVLFTLFLVSRMIRVFFSTNEEVPFQLKLLSLPIAMLLVDNLMEAHIFRYAIMPSILFFLFSGIFLAWSYEVLSCEKKR